MRQDVALVDSLEEARGERLRVTRSNTCNRCIPLGKRRSEVKPDTSLVQQADGVCYSQFHHRSG